MPKQRDKVSMTPEEIRRFLKEVKSLNVATLDASGAPHLTTLWFDVYEDNVIFETYGKSQKVVNLRRDPRIAVLCEAGEDYDELRGVSIKGRAEVVDRAPRLQELMTVLVRRNHPGLSPKDEEALVARMCEKRVVVVVHADKVMSWDHRKLATAANA